MCGNMEGWFGGFCGNGGAWGFVYAAMGCLERSWMYKGSLNKCLGREGGICVLGLRRVVKGHFYWQGV